MPDADKPELLECDEYLLQFMAEFPFDDLDDEFHRGFFAALMAVYEDFEDADLSEPRYLAAQQLKDRMDAACGLATGEAAPDTPPPALRH